MEFDRAQLKQGVKQSMRRTTPSPMLVALLFTVVVSVGSWLINTILGGLFTGRLGNWSTMILAYMQAGYEPEEAVEQALLTLLSLGPGALFSVIVGGSLLSILVSLWQSTMNVGYEGWCLSMVRNENPPMGKIFGALPRFGQVLITRFLTGVFAFLWGLLLSVGYMALLFAAGMLAALTESVLLAVLLMLAAVVYLALGIIWVSVRYALVDYLLLDKGLSGMEALRENKRLMKGNMGRAFKLQLSFAGWYLLMSAVLLGPFIVALGILYGAEPLYDPYVAGGTVLAILGLYIVGLIVIGVLGLWLKPYVTGSMAGFYDWIQGRADGVGGPGFGGGGDGWRQPADYTWTTGPTSGTGAGSDPGWGNGGPAPRPPKPKDDPWKDDPWN